jgi:hypothetical protein
MGVVGDNLGLTASFILPAAACLLVGPMFLFVAPETINVDLPQDVVTTDGAAAVPAGAAVAPAPERPLAQA